MSNVPTIGVVVVHYGADDLTLRCLRSLLADDLSPVTRIVLVDNGPGSAFADLVRLEHPSVQVLVSGSNLGFAAGCNLGIAALGAADLIALVNSDMQLPRGWLTPLVETLAADERCGAACPKILFDERFHTLHLEADSGWRPGRGDTRELAWRLEGARLCERDVTSSCQLVVGFWEQEEVGAWAGRSATLRVPAGEGVESVDLRVGFPTRQRVRLRASSGGATTVLTPDGGWCAVALHSPPEPVINNVGNAWRPDGYGVNVGFQEVDTGQHDTPGPVEAWCGGAVLLRRAYLEDTGGLDERLFLYYEDLELSLRGAALGWRYWYDPRSVVGHRHAASSAPQLKRVARLKERNRLLVLARHGTPAQLAREIARFLLVTLSYLRRDVVAPLLRGDRPSWGTVCTRAAALVAAIPFLPRMVASRRRDRRSRHGMGPLA